MVRASFLSILVGIALGIARAEEPAPRGDGRVAWAEALLGGLRQAPANRLRVTGSRSVPGLERPVALVLGELAYRGPGGGEETARVKLYLPEALRSDPKGKVPLDFVAGYEVNDATALGLVKRGWVVASPAQVDPNPLVRTANPDVALLHVARALPFVDDARVVVGGGSAGGYMALMLAAETFPLAGVMPDVPPVNWGYSGAYFFDQYARVAAAREAKNGREVPFLAAVTPMLEGAKTLYGRDYGGPTWFRHSPLAQIPTITCPVSVVWSTADVLVPMNQVGPRWVQPFDPKRFPEGFTMDPAKLLATREGRLRLLDVLAEADYEAFVLPVPDEVTPARPIELPVSASKRWSVAILDEGPPAPTVGHFKHNLGVSRAAFLGRVMTGRIAAGQLTGPKLERLMDRYAGREWLPTGLTHLDFPETERADVLRGLRTYVAAGPENARTFARLYDGLSPAKRVLGPEIVKGLRGGK